MSQRVRVNAGHADRLQPPQHAQFGVSVTQAVEDHYTDGMLHGGGVAGTAKDAGQAIKAQLTPQLVERPNIAKSQCRFKRNLRRLGHGGGHAFGTKKAFEQRVHLAADFVQAAKSANSTLAGAREFIAIRLNQLNVGATAGLGEFCEHEEKYIKARGALQHILPTQIANNIATTEKSENQLQVLDFIEVHRCKTGFGVELGGSAP
jgi:hypothetical protein